MEFTAEHEIAHETKPETPARGQPFSSAANDDEPSNANNDEPSSIVNDDEPSFTANDGVSCAAGNDEEPYSSANGPEEDAAGAFVARFVSPHCDSPKKARLAAAALGLDAREAAAALHAALPRGAIPVARLGACLGDHDSFWVETARRFPENFNFRGLELVAAIRAYLWTFRLPGESAQIERVLGGFAAVFYAHNADDSDRSDALGATPPPPRTAIEPGVAGYYTRAVYPAAQPELECCAHCGARDGDGPGARGGAPLRRCLGCDVVAFCRPCRYLAHRRGHAVVGSVGYGRACVAARRAAGTLGEDSWGAPTIEYDEDGKGRRAVKALQLDGAAGAWARGRGLFRSEDAAMVLAYSIIMLTTNLHNANVKEKMQLHEFVSQCRGINAGGNFPGDYLADVYDDIAREELKVVRPLD